MGSSSSSPREQEALSFLLFKTTCGFKDFFSEVSEDTVQIGDILLFPTDSSCDGFSSSFKHAAVYCWDGEVIHFQRMKSKQNSGRISKEGYNAMRNVRGKCKIYRKKGRINLDDFRSKVREAMNSKAPYHFGTNNCIHFALFLLDLMDFYMELVEAKNEDGSDGAVTCSPPTPASQKGNHMV